MQKELYADAPDWIVTSACDLRVGGRWAIEFGPPGGPAALETNVFTVVDRPGRLAYVSTMRMPYGTSFDTDMEVRFDEDPGGRTRLAIVQRGFPTRGLRDEVVLVGVGVPGRRAGDGGPAVPRPAPPARAGAVAP